MMKKTILVTLLLMSVFFVRESHAQSFGSAIGARLGVPLSVSYKTFISEANALEFTAGYRGFGSGITRYSWYNVTGSYQIHKPLNIDGVDGLDWYYGFGGTVLFWTYDDAFVNPGSNTNIGIQGYLGLSYTFPNAPVNISVDWVPTYFINGFNNGFGSDYGSVGIRYILGR